MCSWNFRLILSILEKLKANKQSQTHIWEDDAAQKQVAWDTKLKLTSQKPGIPPPTSPIWMKMEFSIKSILQCTYASLIRQGARQLDHKLLKSVPHSRTWAPKLFLGQFFINIMIKERKSDLKKPIYHRLKWRLRRDKEYSEETGSEGDTQCCTGRKVGRPTLQTSAWQTRVLKCSTWMGA